MLQLPRAGLEDAGQYVCTATNSAGQDQKSILLSVYGEWTHGDPSAQFHYIYRWSNLETLSRKKKKCLLQASCEQDQFRSESLNQTETSVCVNHQSCPPWSPVWMLSQTRSPRKSAPLSPWDVKLRAFLSLRSHGTRMGCNWLQGMDWR